MSHKLLIDTPGARAATFDEVCAVSLPEQTRSYRPVPNKHLIELTRHYVTQVLGLAILTEQYALSRKDQQLFALFTIDTGNPHETYAICFRSSYDKSLSVIYAGGVKVFICTNLCMSGDSLNYFRKHTSNIMADLPKLVLGALRYSRQSFETTKKDLDIMRTIPVTKDRGYEIIGRAVGHKVLTPTQANVAYGDWTRPRYEDFGYGNLYCLYQCFNQGLKKGDAAKFMPRHANMHNFMRPMIDNRSANA